MMRLYSGLSAASPCWRQRRMRQTAPANPQVTEAQPATEALEEVVVTARKRSEVLQDIPESIAGFRRTGTRGRPYHQTRRARQLCLESEHHDPRRQ